MFGVVAAAFLFSALYSVASGTALGDPTLQKRVWGGSGWTPWVARVIGADKVSLPVLATGTMAMCHRESWAGYSAGKVTSPIREGAGAGKRWLTMTFRFLIPQRTSRMADFIPTTPTVGC
ncbi:hypothetical protein F4808DRAFT_290179 [Astrocystis sublimbata]|nr:hypothetical protein F4808DRAFT_290179 [Astrocystis sublimbata]